MLRGSAGSGQTGRQGNQPVPIGSQPLLEPLSPIACQVAAEAFHREAKAVQTKSSGADLVTETDKKVEEMIFSFLRQKFPSHRLARERTLPCTIMARHYRSVAIITISVKQTIYSCA